eukprot:GHVL01034122.1.p1 GENE.GHVL01034122.1~~GHVL01034122.1.p1  ORF type:complete len:159 (+),score=18.82 GHVL01034122.1:40-516(+)
MPHSFGKKARTRDKFSKAFRCHGKPSLGRYLQAYKRGDYVDIIVDPSVQKGMPYHYYHGRTGVVFNVTPHALGVQIKKIVGNREILKRLHVRIEHIRKSKCNEDFLKRLKESANKKKRIANGEHVTGKRLPEGPKAGELLPKQKVEFLEPLAFVENYS